MYAVTSEPQTLASQAQRDWQTNMPHVGDPHHEILDACRDKGWLDLYTNQWEMKFVQGDDDWMSHPKGYFQPGVLVLRKDGTVLYRWQSKPSRENIGGAVARPTPEYVWEKLADALSSQPSEDAEYDTAPLLDFDKIFWPRFVLLLLANGWFLGPRVFNLQVGDDQKIKDNVRARQQAAIRRIPFFFALWVLIFIALPLTFAAALLIAWVALVTPGVIRVHKRFQTVP